MKHPARRDSRECAALAPPGAGQLAWPGRRLGVLLALLAVASALLAYRQSTGRGPGRRAAAPPGPSELVSAGIALVREQRWLAATEALQAAMRAGADSAGAHRTLGVCLGELGWIEDTIGEYERAIRLEPSYLFAYVALANAYHSIGRRRDALEALRRAEEQLQADNPRDAASRYARPVAPALEALSESYATLGELRPALRWAEEARTADPTRASGYLLVGKCHLALGQPEAAIAPLRRASAGLGDDADAHYTLALALRGRRSPEHTAEALEHLAAAVRLNPRLAPALFQLGTVHAERKRWKEAHRAFVTAYQLQFEPTECLRQAGEVCRRAGNRPCEEELLGEYAAKRGDAEEALERYRRLALLPDYRVLAYERIAAVESRRNRHQPAIASLKKAIALAPQSGELYRQLAGLYARAQRVDDRIAALRQAMQLDPNGAHADHYALGQLSFDAGRYDEAEQHLEECVRLQPENSQYHYMLGRTYLTRPESGDRLARAISRLESAQRLAPRQGYAHDFLSVAYVKVQRWPEAAAALHHAIDLAPDNGLLYFRLGQVYQHLRRPDEAKWALDFYQRRRKYEADRDLLERGVRARPKEAGAHAALASLLLRGREYAKAEYELYKVLELDPANGDAREKLAVIDGETGRPEAQQRRLAEARRLAARGART